MREQLTRLVFFCVVLTGCTRESVNLDGRACSNGTCAGGYVCSPVTSMCLLPIGQEPVSPGDACNDAGAVMACAGTSCASAGCRTCTAQGIWSACGCPPGDEACQCAIMDCQPCVPSNDGIEACNGLDDDCDSLIDDVNDGANGCVQSWLDEDHDGYGAGTPVCFCAPPQNFVTNNTDPDDRNATIYPDATELCDGLDNNGDGMIPENERDKDGDTYVTCAPWVGSGALKGGDCNDADAGVFPSAPELCDGVANTCDGGAIPTNEVDSDGDHYVACSPWSNRTGMFPDIIGGGDCMPANAGINPGVPEIYDGIDDDCDGKTDPCFADCDCGAGLLACYPLESMPLIDDLSPNDANGNVTGSGSSDHAITAQIGNGYNFDGSIVASIPFDNRLTPDDVTIMAWVKATACAPSTYVYVVDTADQHRLAMTTGCTMVFVGGNGTQVQSVSAVALNTWTHVAGRRGPAGTQVFVNGIPSAATANGSNTANPGAPICIGSNSNNGNNRVCGDKSWAGVIDHVQIFNSALPDATICYASGRSSCP